MLGAISLALGSLVSEWFGNDAGWGLMILGILAQSAGLFLFGLANLKGRVLRRWNALPLVVGLFGGLVPLALSFLMPESSDLPFALLIGALGGGWVLMGGLLLLGHGPEEVTVLNS